MRKDVVLITNNPRFLHLIDSSRIQLLHGTPLDVLIAARDAVHVGNELLTHPLYGNLRPDQQPFRSILLRRSAQKEGRLLESISMIEEAVFLYRSYGSRILTPESLSPAALEDYVFVDCELMRASLTQYGMLS